MEVCRQVVLTMDVSLKLIISILFQLFKIYLFSLNRYQYRVPEVVD